MAAISSLVVTDIPSHPRHSEEPNTPTTPKQSRYPPLDLPEPPLALPLTQSSEPISIPSQQAPLKLERPENASPDVDPMDLDDMDQDSDIEGEEDDGDGDGDPASRKKKGQRFFCTGYPPCNLSFTRSEHLARHIRKHTGERPFQCHCNRRFSRLDNLRQHAQTVHVNEEIPGDSLAATGTRFQRQIRTDRVRQGPRPRSGTMSSTGSHSRGHSRNLSASSIGSTSSNYSTVTEAKRRPPPLAMASDSSRPKLGIELPSTPPGHYHALHSPGGMSTPTSATFSAVPGSPGYGGSSFGSPMSTSSRMYGGPRTPGRRLSVPTGPNPFQPQYGNPYPPSYGAQMGPPSSVSSATQSVYASPTSSTFNPGPGYHVPPSEDWRRRTWHPSTYTATNYNYGRPATSGLLYSQTPDAPQPTYAQHTNAAAGQAPRLPGIESFDHFQQRPTTPPRRQPSPNHMDHKPSMYPELDDKGHVRSGSWGQQAIEEIRRAGSQAGQPVRSDMGPPPSMAPQHQQQIAQEALQIHSSSKRLKRQGWYTGASAVQRTSPEDSSSSDGIPTPGTSAVDVHPIIVPASGYMDSQSSMMPPDSQHNTCMPQTSQMPPSYAERSARERTTSFGERSSQGGDMNRLEALVAVATSGEVTANAAR